MSTAYFDYNATTPVSAEAYAAMEPYLRSQFGNPSSFYGLGQETARAVREARRAVARLIAAGEQEILFTGGGSESNNTAVRAALAMTGRKRIVTSLVEHSSIRKLAAQLRLEGVDVVEIGVDSDGDLLWADYLAALTPETALVSMMAANNETGVLFPLERIARAAHDRGILVHVDAVQAAGKVPLDMTQLPVDYLSLSAHKLYGPKGVGALYIRDGAPFRPLVFGGGQERGRRAGTENVPGLAGFGAACDWMGRHQADEARRLDSLRNIFEMRMKQEIFDARVNGAPGSRIPNTSSLCFEGIEAEALLILLDQKGICASSGSACMSGSQDPSHVLKAMGLSDEDARASVRFSFGRYTTSEEVHQLVFDVAAAVRQLRSIRSKKEMAAH